MIDSVRASFAIVGGVVALAALVLAQSDAERERYLYGRRADERRARLCVRMHAACVVAMAVALWSTLTRGT